MTRLGQASAVVACLPNGVLEQILEIWEARADRHVEMEFKDGRCLEIKVTDTKRFQKEDFKEGAETSRSS